MSQVAQMQSGRLPEFESKTGEKLSMRSVMMSLEPNSGKGEMHKGTGGHLQHKLALAALAMLAASGRLV